MNWPTCPYCGIVINNADCIPWSVMLYRKFFQLAHCPSCKKAYYLQAKKTITFETMKLEEDDFEYIP